jgi:hypothetical protein
MADSLSFERLLVSCLDPSVWSSCRRKADERQTSDLRSSRRSLLVLGTSLLDPKRALKGFKNQSTFAPVVFRPTQRTVGEAAGEEASREGELMMKSALSWARNSTETREAGWLESALEKRCSEVSNSLHPTALPPTLQSFGA